MAEGLETIITDNQKEGFLSRIAGRAKDSFGKLITIAAAVPLCYAVATADIKKGNEGYPVIGIQEAYADSLPADKYATRGIEVTEANFKDTLRGEGVVWVMYDHYSPNISAVDHQKADRFWEVLKKAFGNQVDAFIRIDATEWNNYAKAAANEITKSTFPSFVLYKDGVVVNDGTDKDIRLIGPPKASPDGYLNYIRNNSSLK